MLKISDMKIDPSSLGDKLLLVDVRPRYEYINGQRGNNITGYGYIVVMPAKGFERISVKIDGKQQLEAPADGYVEVQFDNLEIYVYYAQGQYNVGAKATGIHRVNDKH